MARTRQFDPDELLGQHGLRYFDDYKFDHVLWMIILWATSPSQVQKACEELLPPKCRLLRQDTLRMQKLWRTLRDDQRRTAVPPLPSNVMRELLKQQCPDHLGEYYAYRVMERRPRTGPRPGDDDELVFSHPCRDGHGWTHFTAYFDEEDQEPLIYVSVHLSADKQWLYVALEKILCYLNKELALQLVNTPADWATVYRDYLRLHYRFDADPYQKLLEQQERGLLIAQPGFTTQLLHDLHQRGARDLVAVNPILPR